MSAVFRAPHCGWGTEGPRKVQTLKKKQSAQGQGEKILRVGYKVARQGTSGDEYSISARYSRGKSSILLAQDSRGSSCSRGLVIRPLSNAVKPVKVIIPQSIESGDFRPPVPVPCVAP